MWWIDDDSCWDRQDEVQDRIQVDSGVWFRTKQVEDACYVDRWIYEPKL